MEIKPRAPRNRTIVLSDEEKSRYRARLLRLTGSTNLSSLSNRTICQGVLEAAEFLPNEFVDLLIIDPPYNLTKTFNGTQFKQQSAIDYASWMDEWLRKLVRTLRPTASVYLCSDWSSSGAVQPLLEKYFKIRNRITWEREKGRGALRNWKNCSEDIWFCTVSDAYTFNSEAVKLKRRVVAPYTDQMGTPKDWSATEDGNWRYTFPSNLWTDITVPFWSMPENTDHPTQKPEKLIAKIVLASSNEGDVVFDPFAGSGTTSVVAKKLGRRFVGVEVEEMYCCLAEKRLELANRDSSIQGYYDGVFWERNSLTDQQRSAVNGNRGIASEYNLSLFAEGSES